MRINRKQFKKWIRALRSGKYKQTQSMLHNSNGYCCLGVACKVLIPKNKLELDEDNYITGDFPERQEAAPKWLKEINSNFAIKNNYTPLSELNDDQRLSFKEIADLLVETYPERKTKK